ncbi:MAG: TonB-dependent receptor [Longimicrobiales bacterium]
MLIPSLLVGLALTGSPLPHHSSVTGSALRAQERPIPLDTLQVQVGSRASSRLPALTRSVQILDKGEIRALPVRTVSGLLEWATGVEVQSRSPAQSDLSIRGAGFEQVVVLVNGVRMSDPQTGHFDLNLTVPLDQVERIEILRGPASALYGADAVGGVVNVVTREGSSPWQGRVETGSWGSARISGSGGMEGILGFSLQGGGEVSRSDGHRQGTDYETLLFHMGGDRALGKGRLSGEFGLSRRDFGAQDFYAPYPSFEKTRSYTTSLRWASGGEGRAGLEAGMSYRRHQDEFILLRQDPDYYRNRHTSSQVGGDLLTRISARPGLNLVLGGELFGDILRSNSLGDRTEERGALFGEAALDGDGIWVVSLGLREDWHQGFGTFLSPSLSGSHRVGESLRLRLAAGRSFRAPTFTERYYQDPVNQGRADLAPERAWSGEMGADFFGRRGIQLSATLFAREAVDLIDWAREEGAGEEVAWETRNVEEATFRGLELDLSLPGPLETAWTFGGMLLSVDSRESQGYRSKYVLRPLVERFTAGIRRSFGGRLSFALRTQRSRREGEDPYHRIDLRADLRIGGGRVYLDATNLTDDRYPDITGAQAPGRGLFVGLELGPGR